MKCERCHTEYPAPEGNFRKTKTGFEGTCKPCRAIVIKARRANQTPEQKERERARLHASYQRHKESKQQKRETRRKSNMAAFAERQRHYRRKQDPEYRERNRAASRENYAKNRDARLARAKSRREEMRAEMIAAYGGKCACCGEKIPRFLTLDHKHGNGRWHRKTMSSIQILGMLKEQGWPSDDYELLCFNCNCGREYNGGICPHQSNLVDSLPQDVQPGVDSLANSSK